MCYIRKNKMKIIRHDKKECKIYSGYHSAVSITLAIVTK